MSVTARMERLGEAIGAITTPGFMDWLSMWHGVALANMMLSTYVYGRRLTPEQDLRQVDESFRVSMISMCATLAFRLDRLEAQLHVLLMSNPAVLARVVAEAARGEGN